LFARESTVGLKSNSWGEVRFGRQTNPAGDALGQFDVNSGYMDPLVFNGGYGGAGFTAESRWDNSVKYTIAPNSMFKTSLMYRMPDTGSVRQAMAGAAYLNLNNVRFAAFAGRINDAELATAGSTAGTLTVQFANTKATGLLAAVDATPTLTFKGGWERITTSAPSAGNYAVDATMTSLSGVTVSATNNTAYAMPRTENMYWIGASYMVTPNVKLNGAFYERTTSEYGASATASCTTGLNGGVGAATNCATSSAKYYVGEVIDSLSKRTDVYVNATYTQLAGPVWSNYYPSQLSVATGIRHAF